VTAALFGKLPAHGDFVSRGLDLSARDALDAWLSAEIAAAREAFGDAFAERFDVAPGWCFAFPGAAGWTAGALAPSVDMVGRRFPLIVARGVADADAAGGMALACGDAIHAALTEGWDADRLHVALAALTPPEVAPPAEAGWWLADVAGKPVERLAGERPPGLLRAMLAERETA
jgi:type VI secretion system protein ImpM